MRTRTAARLYTVVVIGLIWAAIWFWLHRAACAYGKDAFLAGQALRFDKFYPPHPNARFVILDILSSIVGMAILIGVYELLASGIYKAIRVRSLTRDASEKPNQSLEPTAGRCEVHI